MYEMDYDVAASYWIEKEKSSAHLDEETLKNKIDGFLKNHNTCALATASKDMVRNTPIEYNYLDGVIYLFSEGGLKFKALKENKNVSLAIFESYEGFGKLKSLQIEAIAEIVEPFSDEYLKLLKHKNISEEWMRKLPKPLYLIKVVPKVYDLLDSDLKKDGFDNRQHLEIG